ncbi:MAG: hypothetical protein RBR38_10280 [Desulfomicrobium apsheronum]|nr:hypothetical protein [Desulfomicrobium apsheronum]
MGDVKRYTVAPSTLIEVEDGYIVLHSDYAVLESKFKTACTQNKALLSQRNSILARYNALEEAVKWEREFDEALVWLVQTGRYPRDMAGKYDLAAERECARAEVDRLLAEGDEG